MQNDIKILLYTQAGTEYDVSYINEIPMSLNLLIADVRQPDKRNSTFSKTINLPGTKEVNAFFELIWKTNISLQYFNPNLKCKIYYYINGVEQIKGDLQLLRINVNDETGEAIYECSIVGKLGNLFLAFGDALLTDLTFNEFDHVLNKANITDSWATQIQVSGSPVPFAYGNGYVYPPIDYGLNNGDFSNFKVGDFRPALFKKTILDKAFALAGYTYSSAYFNSSYYKHLIIPAVQSSTFQVSGTYKNNSQFYAGRATTDQTSSSPLVYIGYAGLNYWNKTLDTQIIFNDDTTTPFNDAGGNYNTSSGELIIVNPNTYDLTSILQITLTFSNTPLQFATILLTGSLFNVYIQKFISGSWVNVAISTTNISGLYTSASLVNSISTTFFATVILPGQTTVAGDKFRVSTRAVVNVNYYDLSSLELTIAGQTATCTQLTKISSVFYSNLTSLIAKEGLPISCNYVLPTNTKIIDWLMNEVYLGNLYMEQDKDDDKNIIIEDRDSFYTGVLNWTDKRDYSVKRVVTPMGDLDWKRYDFSYKKDEDFANRAYFDEFGEVYGSGFYEIKNDFIKGKQKKELMYSASPVVGNNTNGLVISKPYKIENSTVKPFKSNIRFLYYGGVIPLSFGSWTLKSTLAGDTVYTTFPYAGDSDNPYNPTISINWDTPKKIYYNYQLATYTNNNLKNRFYSRHINQITDKNSKIELRNYVLGPYDIKQFSFRKIIFDTDAYFIANAIRDYDVLKGDSQSTPVELLKLVDYDAFVPSITPIATPPSFVGAGSERLIGMSTTTGENNNNFGTSSRISGGSGNYISPGAKGVELTNCTNVIVNSDVVGFIGSGITNKTIDNSYSNMTYIGNRLTLSGGLIPVYTTDPINPAVGDTWYLQTIGTAEVLQGLFGAFPISQSGVVTTDLKLKVKLSSGEIFKTTLTI